LDAINRLTALI